MMLENDVRLMRTRLGLSQAELARRAGLSRAGISALETGRLVPSTAAALALAAALGCTVEALFRLPGGQGGIARATWAWPPQGAGPCRYWQAEIGGRLLHYPVEVSPLGLLPQDGLFQNGAFRNHPGIDPARTLVLASCDPAVGLLAAELARAADLRLIVIPRSSRGALELLARGLVHAAGIHLARSEREDGNAAAVRQHLGAAGGQEFQLIRLADWEEGIARRTGDSGSRRCGPPSTPGSAGSGGSRAPGRGNASTSSRVKPRAMIPPDRCCVRDHRGVADAIRAHWADAGVCLRLTSEEAGLAFLSVRS